MASPIISTLRSMLMADNTAPGVDAVAVTPSDSVNFTNGPCRALWVGGAGNVVVFFTSGNTVTFTGVLAGSLLPVQALRVNATLTTATNIVAVY